MMFFLESAYFGVILTIFSYQFGLLVLKKTKWTFLHPLLIAILTCVLVLLGIRLITHQSLDQIYEDYEYGGNLIQFFLAPLTVMLALPMYRQFKIIKTYFFPLLLGVATSVLTNFLLVFWFVRSMHYNLLLSRSIYAKNITNPMALSLTDVIHGNSYITTILVVFSGVTGAVVGPLIFRLFPFAHPIAKGVAFGSNSHAVGTARAFEYGEQTGAISSACIGMTGLITVIILPILLSLL